MNRHAASDLPIAALRSPREDVAILERLAGMDDPDQHRSERPVLLAADQQLGEGPPRSSRRRTAR